MSNPPIVRTRSRRAATIALTAVMLGGVAGCSNSVDNAEGAAGSECSESMILQQMTKAGNAELSAESMKSEFDTTQTADRKGRPIPGRRALNYSAFETALNKLGEPRYNEIDQLVGVATVPEIATLLAKRTVSITDLVTYYVSRIRRFDDGKLNSVTELDPTALLQAKAADSLIDRCAQALPMLGIPVLLKDNITAGPSTHTTAGAAALADWRPTGEASLVSNLRAAGAIVLGKANLSEWANYVDRSMPNGYSAMGGQTRNPYAGEETYGSSSGSAVAASARFAALTVGTETQGSLILPAVINSAVAIRPSGGLISQAGIVPLYARQDTAGPMAQNVTDLAYGMNAMVGPDAADSRSDAAAAGHKIDYVAALKIDPSVRIGVPVTPADEMSSLGGGGSTSGGSGLEAELAQQSAEHRKRELALADALTAAGATVVQIETPVSMPEGEVDELLAAGFRSDLGKFLTSHDGVPFKTLAEIVAFNKEQPAQRIPYGQGLLIGAVGAKLTDAQLAEKGAALEAEVRKGIDAALTEHKVDVVISESQAYAQASYPAIAVPTGYGKDGVPQGITLVGRYLEDAKVLSAAFAVEQAMHAWKPPALK